MKINMLEEIKKVSQEPYNTSEFNLYPVFVNIGIACNIIPDKEYEFDPIICMNTARTVGIISHELLQEFEERDFTFQQQIELLASWCLFAGVGISHEVLFCGNCNIDSGMANIINPKGIASLDDYIIEEMVSCMEIDQSTFRDHAIMMGTIAALATSGDPQNRLERIGCACRAMFIYGTIIAKEYITR